MQVLLEAQVKGLTNGADDVLGQPIRTLQDVTRWQGGGATDGTHGDF